MSRLTALRKAQASVNLTGHLAVVVGGTSGVGQGVAVRLAQAGASVVVVGRDAQRGGQVVDSCKQAGGGPNCAFIPCNALLLSNVKQTSDVIAAKTQRIDFLVLTQGIGSIAGRTETAEGLEQKLALHYYSRYGFVQCLAPLLKQSPDPRVLSVMTAGIHPPYRAYREDPDLKVNFSVKNAADACCMYNDLAADFMSELHPPIKFIHAAPGFVATRWGTEMPTAVRWLVRLLQKAGRSPADCAEYMCFALFSNEFKSKRFLLMTAEGESAKQTAIHDEAKPFIRDHTLQTLDRLLM